MMDRRYASSLPRHPEPELPAWMKDGSERAERWNRLHQAAMKDGSVFGFMVDTEFVSGLFMDMNQAVSRVADLEDRVGKGGETEAIRPEGV